MNRSIAEHYRWRVIPQSQQQSATNDMQRANGYAVMSGNIEEISELISIRTRRIREVGGMRDDKAIVGTVHNVGQTNPPALRHL